MLPRVVTFTTLLLCWGVFGAERIVAQTPSLAEEAGPPALEAAATPALSEVRELQALVIHEQRRLAELEAAVTNTREALAAVLARLKAIAPQEPSAATAPVASAPAAPPLPSDEVPRFVFSADALVRLATLHQGYDGCIGCPDRTIGRYRMRFGAEGRLAPGLRAVFGLSAGELNDPNSVYQTLGGNLGRKVTTWDRVYLAYQPPAARWVEVSAGKFPYPWVRSSMTFDVDFYPEGLNERFSFDTQFGPLRHLSLQSMQIVVNEQASQPDTLLIGGQASAQFALGSRWTSRAILTGIHVQHPEFVLRSQFDGTNVGVRNTNAITNDGGLRYRSAFRYANLIVENAFRTPWTALPVTVAVEYQRNLRAASRHDTGASFRFDAGRQQRPGDIGLSWHIFRVEQDAIVSALGESDWRAPSNVQQHRVGLTYTAHPHVQALFTLYRGRTLNRDLPGAVLVPALPPGRREPWANRLYFDLMYRF